MGISKVTKKKRAAKKIKEIKNFHWFLVIAFFASVFMIGFAIFLYNKEGVDAFVINTINLGTVGGLWVIILLEYVRVFKNIPFLGKAWEDKQIQKYIKKDTKEI